VRRREWSADRCVRHGTRTLQISVPVTDRASHITTRGVAQCAQEFEAGAVAGDQVILNVEGLFRLADERKPQPLVSVGEANEGSGSP
jgi:hypothetical protein